MKRFLIFVLLPPLVLSLLALLGPLPSEYRNNYDSIVQIWPQIANNTYRVFLLPLIVAWFADVLASRLPFYFRAAVSALCGAATAVVWLWALDTGGRPRPVEIEDAAAVAATIAVICSFVVRLIEKTIAYLGEDKAVVAAKLHEYAGLAVVSRVLIFAFLGPPIAGLAILIFSLIREGLSLSNLVVVVIFSYLLFFAPLLAVALVDSAARRHPFYLRLAGTSLSGFLLGAIWGLYGGQIDSRPSLEWSLWSGATVAVAAAMCLVIAQLLVRRFVPQT